MTQRGCKYHPALKHALTFALGIASAHLLNVPPDALLCAVAFSLLWLVAAARFDRLLLPAAVVVAVALSGGLWYTMREHRDLPAVVGAGGENLELVGTVASDPVVKEGRMEWSLKPDSLLYRNSSARLKGKVIVRLYDSTAVPANVPRYGEKITLKGAFRLPAPPRVPGEFDYGAWLAGQGIAGTFDCYRRGEIYAFGSDPPGGVERGIRAVRLYVREFVERHVGGEEGDILMALLLGDRAEIDQTTRDAFARTGTSHVLAVSGLHVGLIALLLFVCVSWLRNRWLRFGIFIALLGAYVVLVGSPPSVVRAGVMAAVFLLAYNTGRLARPLNTLGVSALVLLLIEPSWLFDVGFQLSFAAVAGIIMLYAPLFGYLSRRFPRIMKHLFLQRTTQLFLISVSAQLFTLPLTIYYFGYVSLISPLVNIPVVPLTTLGLGAGLAGVLTAELPGVSHLFGAAAWMAVRGARLLVEWSASFDAAGVQVFSFGPLLPLAMLGGVVYLTLSRSPGQVLLRFISLSFLCVLLFLCDRRFDPLADSGSGYLYLAPLSRSGGIVAAVHSGDTLSLYYGGLNVRDSAAAERIGRGLAGRLGARTVLLTDLLKIPPHPASSPAKDSDLLPANEFGPEYLSRRVPAIFSNTRRRSPGFVMLKGIRLAQIPLQRRIGRGVVLDPRPEWRVVEWE